MLVHFYNYGVTNKQNKTKQNQKDKSQAQNTAELQGIHNFFNVYN